MNYLAIGGKRCNGTNVYEVRRDNPLMRAIRAEGGSGVAAGGAPLGPKDALIASIKGKDINFQAEEIAKFIRSLPEEEGLRRLPEIIIELYASYTIRERAKAVAIMTIGLSEEKRLGMAGIIAQKWFAGDPVAIGGFGCEFAYEETQLLFGPIGRNRAKRPGDARKADRVAEITRYFLDLVYKEKQRLKGGNN